MAIEFEEKWEDYVPTPKTDIDGRDEYEKDYDKIIFSQCFRRLSGKTQVHPFSHNDHVHTRLSHSLEVSIVGRSIVKELVLLNVIPPKKEQDCIKIVMSAGIAHDMGNPPLGHTGEDAIGSWVKSHSDELVKLKISQDCVNTYFSYDGNAQNFHIFNNLEYFEEKGLSYATTAALVKYPKISSDKNPKAGFFKADQDKFDEVFDALKLKKNGFPFRHPLSYVMEAADDICYSMMDVDDAYEMGIHGNTTKIQDIAETELGISKNSDNIFGEIRAKRGILTSKAVKGAAEAFKKNLHYIMDGNVSDFAGEPVPNDKKDLIVMGKDSNDALKLISLLKKFAAENVFGQRDKVVYETACYSIIGTIFDSWLKAYSEYKQENPSLQSKKVFSLMNLDDSKRDDEALIQIIDYVSGMTDRFAKFTADTLSGRLSV